MHRISLRRICGSAPRRSSARPGVSCLHHRSDTPMRERPQPRPDTTPHYAINRVRWMTIGGIPQAFHFLAKRAEAPLLLFVHGGPGVPHMPFAYVNAALADCFVVIQWDQRGAGKTFHATAPQTVTLERLVLDGCEAIELLCAEFRRDAVVLVGHSCGSAIAALIAARCPEYVRAFVGIAQVTNLQAAERIRYELARQWAVANRDQKALRQLEELGSPPYCARMESDLLEQIASGLNGDCVNPFADERYRPLAAMSRLYSDEELGDVGRGIRHSQDCLWDEIAECLDLAAQVPRLDVPTAFVVGGVDAFAPATLAEAYFCRLHAPRGKQLYRIARLGHWLHLEAPRLYRAALQAVIRPGLGCTRGAC